MNRKSVVSLLLIVCMLTGMMSVAIAADEWTEADFVFYNSDMAVSGKPVAGDQSSSCISLKERADGQTYRGITVGSYPEEFLEKYDLKDAEWSIYSASMKESKENPSRSEKLTEKWLAEGKNGADVVAMSDFLFAKDYYYYIKLDIYRFNGQFVTKSQLPVDYIESIMREAAIENVLNHPENIYSRKELEEKYDEWYLQEGKGLDNYYLRNQIQKYKRAFFSFRIENGIITRIELTDYYYSQLANVYNDDGTINDQYAYILDLK